MRDVLVDTSVWSLAFRRNQGSSESELLKQLIHKGRVVIIGPIRQELLSGLREEKQFLKLKNVIAPFLDLKIISQEYEMAAQFSNTCRKNGIQGSPTDYLICSVAATNSLTIFTTDKDFELYARHLPISLYQQ